MYSPTSGRYAGVIHEYMRCGQLIASWFRYANINYVVADYNNYYYCFGYDAFNIL